ncbi:MAG TPA: Ig-like domain-containing protein, partial [Blastocatellia bacterium]|nr:Ig-like domain-containing protein [Blastocatellia bacterium]
FLGGAPLGSPIPVVGGAKFGFAQATASYFSSLPVGQDTITAQYNGDSNYLASPMSAPVSIHILATTTTTITASPGATVQQNQSVTFTVQVVVNETGGPMLTGTVQFLLNGVSGYGLGGPVALSNGQAQVTTSSLPPGSDLIEANYSGDANNESSGGSFTLTVNPAFTISANPMTISIAAPGQAGSTALTFTSQNGFSSNGNVNLTPSMCSGLPAESTCSFSPPVINLAANGTATTALTVSTTAPSAAILSPRGHHDDLDSWKAGRIIPIGFSVCLGMLLLGLGRRKRRPQRLAFAAILLALLLADIGCGGGAGNNGGQAGGGVTNPGTPAGVSYVTVTVTINGFTETLPNIGVQVQ